MILDSVSLVNGVAAVSEYQVSFCGVAGAGPTVLVLTLSLTSNGESAVIGVGYGITTGSGLR